MKDKEDKKAKAHGTKKVRKGDRVLVRAGNSKGKSGVVLRAFENYVVVQGLNLCKKHVKPTEAHPRGGVITMEAPIHVSNVTVCNEDGTILKLKTLQSESGERSFYSIKGSEKVEYRKMKSPKSRA